MTSGQDAGAVVLDLFGVVARLQSEDARRCIEQVAGVRPGRAEEFWRHYRGVRHPYDRGDVDGPEYWALVAAESGLRFPDVGALIEADCDSWKHVDEEAVELVHRLADGPLPFGLLSNIPRELLRYVEEQWSWLDRFDVLGFSCRIGAAKPEAEAFAWMSTHLDVPLDELFFVDDTDENLVAARSLGIETHHMTGIAGLREALERRGLLR